MNDGEENGARQEWKAMSSPEVQEDARLGGDRDKPVSEEDWPILDCYPNMDMYYKLNKLNIIYGDVTEDDLINATLFTDEQFQIALLNNLFEACALSSEIQQKERAILVREIAKLAPRNEREREIIYHRAIAHHLAIWCARGTVNTGGPIQAALAMASMFQKLSGHCIAIDDKLAGMRAASAIREGPVIEHPALESAERLRLALARRPEISTQRASQWDGDGMDARPAQGIDLSSSQQTVGENGEPCACAVPHECGHDLI